MMEEAATALIQELSKHYLYYNLESTIIPPLCCCDLTPYGHEIKEMKILPRLDNVILWIYRNKQGHLCVKKR